MSIVVDGLARPAYTVQPRDGHFGHPANRVLERAERFYRMRNRRRWQARPLRIHANKF